MARAGIGIDLMSYGQDVQQQGTAAAGQVADLESRRVEHNRRVEDANRQGNAQLGATVGAAAGTMFGPVGTMIGGLAGGLIGGLF